MPFTAYDFRQDPSSGVNEPITDLRNLVKVCLCYHEALTLNREGILAAKVMRLMIRHIAIKSMNFLPATR